MSNSHNPQGDARANRLRVLRKITGHSRKAFALSHGISQGTLQNWETARFGGLTEKGARTVLQALKEEGVSCEFEWLMYGIGSGPDMNTKFHHPHTEPKEKKLFDFQACREAQADVFQSMYTSTLKVNVEDDSMAPYHVEGQTVLGKLQNNLLLCDNLICIVDTKEYGTLLRLVRLQSKRLQVHLYATNLYSKQKYLALNKVTINQIAPVSLTLYPVEKKITDVGQRKPETASLLED